MSSPICSNDDTFGPNVSGCRNDFDFTIKFEELFFSVIPSAVFIVLSIWRIALLSRRRAIVDAPILQLAKLGSIAAYIVLDLAILVMVAMRSYNVTQVAISSAALRLACGLCMIGLSFFDHARSPRPSMLLNTYLLLTVLLDVAQVRTSWLASKIWPEAASSAVFTASVATKAVILILEAQSKKKWVRWDAKDHSPEETSSIYSLGVFFWLNTLFVNGYHNILQMGDLFPLDTALCGDALRERLSARLKYSKLRGDKYGLLKVLTRTFIVPLLLPIPARLALLAFTFCQPFLINSVLNYLSASDNTRSANVGYGFIGASILIYSGIGISMAFYRYLQYRMLFMVRGALVIAIYKKATESRLAASHDMASVTLMSTDTERIDMSFRNVHEFWANTIEIALASWLLYREIGAAFVASIVVALCCAIALLALVRYIGPAQRAWMGLVQKRVSMTANGISNMKNLKISGLTTSVSEFVQNMRVEELKSGSMALGLTLIPVILALVPRLVSPFMTFVFAQQNMNAVKLFTTLSYLLLLANPLMYLFQCISKVAAGLACLGRIQAFLEGEDHEDFRIVQKEALVDSREALPVSEKVVLHEERPSTFAIMVNDGNFGWEKERMILHNINIKIPRSALTLVVGPIASGKSTLCISLLGEIPYRHGQIHLANRFVRVGYCDQTPFLLNATIKENIVGFSPFDPKRYAEVIEATMLVTDFETLPEGDNSNVGSNGITLSGGQRQRVSLARALYLQTDLLIFDDVLSGLDADTEDQVFRRVFGIDGIIRRRCATAVLCTHSVRHLPNADHIIALGIQGTVVEQGNYEDLLANQSYIYSLGIKALDSDASSDESAILAQKGPELIPAINAINATKVSIAVIEDEKTRQTGDSRVYKHYFQSMGYIVASSIFFFGALLGFLWNFPTIWLKWWSDDTSSVSPAHSFGYYVGIYSLLQLCFLLVFGAMGWVVNVVVVKRSGAKLHKDALRTLIHAPLRFFTTTDQGIIINLFSQDLNIVDSELPNAILALCYSVFVAIGSAAILLTASPYMAVSYPFLAALLYTIQKFYLRTSRQLRLLDLAAKSPLYTHFLDTIKGILTLRAFNFIAEDQAKNIRLLDTSQRPAYLLIMIQQWLTLVLNMVIMVLGVILITLAIKLRSNSGFTGASLITLMQFGEELTSIVIFFTMLETSIGAISRLRSFSNNVIPEDKEETENIEPPEDWPQRGKIQLKNVSASYDSSGNKPDVATPSLALREISLTILPGEKVAVCGRTGSGKSSLIALLLKLLDPLPAQASEESTSIYIDDTPLARLNRSVLRSRIIAVPQDAVFLPDGTSFQTNLDPSTTAATAADCESVLRIVGLWIFVQERGGLEAGMIASTLSQGQCQLFSLARAVLRKRMRSKNIASKASSGESPESGGILLLDEVSSSVDQETEKAMQEIIRQEFREYTIVAVSHRLDMIIDFDRVIVMDKGEVVEVGNPRLLAESEGTRFGELWSLGKRS